MNKIDLNNYVCLSPFKSMEIHKYKSYVCCPSWLNTSVDNQEYDIKNLWESNIFNDIRKSMLDGSFKYCDKNTCLHLSALLNGLSSNDKLGPIVKKEEFKDFISHYDEETNRITDGPSVIQFTFDQTCNYRCPSCRTNTIVAKSDEIEEINEIIKKIEESYSDSVKVLYITGSGDPFVSVVFRTFLREFDPTKYPNLKRIHLHTNASMWNKEMWESMSKIHPYVQSCEISIDAAKKETYENVTRLGGKWDNLMNNLNFIKTIKTLESIRTSFVVQAENYTEMEDFVYLMKNIFGKRSIVYFGKILNWGTFSEDEYMIHKVWDKSHPEYENFLIHLNKIRKFNNVFHNMHEQFDQNKSLI